MWKTTEALTLIQGAEKAAEAGDFLSAENLLREAARRQETNLGPRHPDLANTLNNLGIVCEVIGKPDDAEQYFRRAVSIARTSLPPDHPFVATSQKNLRDFCEARGKHVDVAPPVEMAATPTPEAQEPLREAPAKREDKVTSEKEAEAITAAAPAPPARIFAAQPAQVFAAPPTRIVSKPPSPIVSKPPSPIVSKPSTPIVSTPATPIVSTPPTPPTPIALEPPTPIALALEEPEDPEVTSKRFFTRVAIGALGPIAMLMVVLAAGLPRLGAPELGAPFATASVSARDVAPPPAPVEPIPALEEPAAAASSEDVDELDNEDVTPSPAPAVSVSDRPAIVRASLCGDLEDWACDPADRPVPSGPVFFYTVIKSTSATTVQHRWYHDGRLLQTVEFRVQPNRTPGYRTYSRNVMKSDSAGNWRVEVRSEDGAVLHQERFTVR